MNDFRERLEAFLVNRRETAEIEQLTPDASTREYFRVHLAAGPAIACVYPESFVAAEQSYIDVTNLFRTCGLPVAQIYAFDEKLGVILLEDFGDRILRNEIASADPIRREELIDGAIELIPRIQAATDTAYAVDSIASRSVFDVEKLMWELDFFKTHYFTTLRSSELTSLCSEALEAEFLDISQELESSATVLCHRDFHAANLMVKGDELRIIDHQDARIGSPAYDLVSLLLDRIIDPPPADWLASKRRVFLEARVLAGLDPLSESAFAHEFRLQTIQRCLKAAGTFSYQSAARRKTHFIQFIKPMFRIVLRAAENIDRYPVLQSVLRREIESD